MPDTTGLDAPVQGSTEPEVERLAREVAELRAGSAAKCADLQAELDAVRAQVMGQNRALEPDAALRRDRSPKRRLGRRQNGSDDASESSGLVSRRRLFGLLGGAAAVGTGLAVAGSTLSADPAAASDGSTMVVGSNANNNPGVPTKLTGSTAVATPFMFEVDQTGTFVEATAILGSTASSTGVGVYGAGATGVFGNTATGTGVSGSASGTGGTALFGISPSGASLVLDNSGQVMPPTSGTWQTGSFVVSGGNLWFCQAGGTGAAAVFNRISPLVTIAPARVYDSRVGQSPATLPKSPITNGGTVNIDVTGTQATPPGGPSGVPTGVSAVLGNVTLVAPSNGVFLTLYAAGATEPSTSNINGLAGGVVANNFTSKLGSGGSANKIAITCGGGPTDFIIDIFGYYP